MLAKAEALLSSADVLIFAAAVADYMPAEICEEKLPKYTTDFTLTLKPIALTLLKLFVLRKSRNKLQSVLRSNSRWFCEGSRKIGA